MKKIFLIGLIVLLPTNIYSQDLPGRHELIKNDSGEYYVVNSENITMIEPSILKLGSDIRWILACIKNKSIDSDLKRWVFIDVASGGTYDSIHKQNWEYFSNEAFPELKSVKLKSLSDEGCP
tara:strand:- start:86 stop:451 length:366 start_codon:yes stop_codon:yes gene_type:complete